MTYLPLTCLPPQGRRAGRRAGGDLLGQLAGGRVRAARDPMQAGLGGTLVHARVPTNSEPDPRRLAASNSQGTGRGCSEINVLA